MATWEKKIRSGGGKDLQPGETLVAGLLLNPPGTTGKAVSRGVGGLVGGALRNKFGATGDERGGEIDSDTGVAARFPDQPVWLAVTPTRILVWRHSTMSGKPKDLQFTLDRAELTRVEAEKLKATYTMTLHFADGSARAFEAPKMFNDPSGFAATINGA